ncbi:MAG: IS200/IS605 family element transposase accessory protein TnpB [Acaryochloris sp. RU_4_1]|nr:IS200/IS605 family element transposase accessory protein TnpB [Acaryochloris sp. RU_4_1]NJR57203.1 IS200/IS605 family element transposase accessory protein TnpB [Acaryochloris sp. CRU_2_0]
MLKAVKVRIYPTQAQQAHLAKAFGCVRWVWNQSLATMTATYQQTGKGVTAMTMKKSIPLWKAEFEWLSECYSQCLQQSVLNLGVAFGNFFDGRAMYPTFKKRQGKQSIQYPQNVKILSDYEIKFPGKLGTVNAKVHRDIKGTLKTVTLSKNPDGRYFASMLVDDGIECPESSSDGKILGIDLGLTDFAVTSEGSKYQHPRATKKHENNLARKQKKLSLKKNKTSNNRRKARLAVAKVHCKIKRVREDFLHKLSRKIVDQNQVIVVENLAVRNMVKNHCLAQAISDAGWGMFCTMLKYKAERVGKVYLEIGRFFASTHLCSDTLKPLPKMDLSVREFDCPHCNHRHDRDINAAINIKNEGLRVLTLGTSVIAPEGYVRPKQYGRKSTTIAAVVVEGRSPHSNRFGESVG